MKIRTAAVITVSDRVTAGTRQDESGPALAGILEGAGFEVTVHTVPDEQEEIAWLIRSVASGTSLVVTTGGTGFAERDVTPEATRSVIEREAPGLADAMRAAGRIKTPMADLSRGVAGILGRTVVLNTPGSPKGAVESLEAVLPVLPHALDHLAGDTEH